MGTLNLPMRFEELSSLSPIVRKEVLTGELSRRLRGMSMVRPNEVDSLAESLVGLSLAEVIEGIHSPEVLSEQVRKLKSPPTPEATPQQPVSVAPSSSGDSSHPAATISIASTPALPASAPEHPSTPVSYAASLDNPARTSSPAGSIALGSEKDKFLASVTRLHPAKAAELTQLLLQLPKKERAMCLFNPEYLKVKVAEAVEVLEADDDGDKIAPQATIAGDVAAPKADKVTNGNGADAQANAGIPQTPDLSSNGPSALASPSAPSTPNPPPATVHTLASLARLPALEIINLASSPSATGLPLPKADPDVFKATNNFIDGLSGMSDQQQKQMLGQKL